MTKRVVLFIFFVLLTGSIFYAGNYKNLYDKSTRDLSYNAFKAEQKRKADMIAAKAKAAANKGNEEVVLIDMNNPLIKKGHDLYTGSAQCIKCHGDMGQGNVEEKAPLLAGQHDWYVEDQLKQMKAGSRPNDKMNEYIANLSDSDFKALAKYISLLRIK